MSGILLCIAKKLCSKCKDRVGFQVPELTALTVKALFLFVQSWPSPSQDLYPYVFHN